MWKLYNFTLQRPLEGGPATMRDDILKLFMGEEWHRKTIAIIRWKLVEIAGKVIRHGRRVILKIVASVEKLRIFLEIRRRCLDFR